MPPPTNFGKACGVLALAFAAVGCNLVSGADDLFIVRGDDDDSQSVTSGGGGNTSSSGNASGSGAATTTGGGSPGASGVTSGAGGSGGNSPCPPCSNNEHCEEVTGSCQCDPGFIDDGAGCVPAPVGDPSTHTQSEVCQAWADGHLITDPNPVNAGGADCDAGSLSPAGLTDTLTRINMFRWFVGLGPVTDDAGFNAAAQLCANLEAWWPFQGGSAHNPPASSKCYTSEGAASAGQSNIAWGSNHPAPAIDQFMADNGNATTMGHRRWIINPPLGKVGIGYWESGGIYGNAECLRVFDGSGSGPNPSWSAVPNQGFVPVQMAQWTWTFHANIGGVPNANVTMLRVDDNSPLAVNVQTLQQGFAQPAISWTPNGWTVVAGETYRVTIAGLTGGDVTYDVKPVSCN